MNREKEKYSFDLGDIKKYYKNIDFSCFNEELDFYAQKILHEETTREERGTWGMLFYKKYLDLIEIFLVNIFAISESNIKDNIFIQNHDFYNKVKERFYKNFKKGITNDEFSIYFLNNWIFSIKKDQINNYENKFSLYKKMIYDIVNDFLIDKEFLNAYKHSFRNFGLNNQYVRISIDDGRGNSINIDNKFDINIFYLAKKKDDVYRKMICFNVDSLLRKCNTLISMFDNMKLTLLNKEKEISLSHLYIDDIEKFTKNSEIFRASLDE